MHINYARGETRAFVGRRRKFRPGSNAWYKRKWNRDLRRWQKANLGKEEEGPASTSRCSRRQKTRSIYG